jgi:serine/threonine-protein phosphatase 2B catalytic subunit
MVNAPIEDAVLFSEDPINWEILRDFLKHGGQLTKPQCVKLLHTTQQTLRVEPNLVKLKEPLCVVGDIHGQFYDLLHMIQKAGQPSKNIGYLFLGDFVDRGVYGVQVCQFLFALKLCKPDCITLLRGNHESRSMTEMFSFRNECIEAYDEEVYDLFMDTFDMLPIAALIEDKYLAMHGGISPHLETLDNINDVDRFCEVPEEGLMCDLLWSDPMKDDQAEHGQYEHNRSRDCSYTWGKKPVKDLMKRNGLFSIFRAHQV